jgi:hypothetical protein
VGTPPELESIRPTPSAAEVAAIVAAAEALWPKPVVADAGAEAAASPVWRFAGRWWRKPIAARRDRPW